VVVSTGDLNASLFQTQYRMDSLLFGVILAAFYWMKPGVYKKFASQKWLLLSMVGGLIAWLVLATPHFALDQSIGYTIQAIGFTAAIVLAVEYSGAIRDSIAYRAVAWIGVYSYGIYLWHTLALAPGDIMIRKMAALHVPPLAAWAFVMSAQFCIAIVVGYVTTRAIEFPFLKIRDALFPAKRKGEMEVPVVSTHVS
jgi:peptidoglycan/LPS O-acetylase OafA/YrhL